MCVVVLLLQGCQGEGTHFILLLCSCVSLVSLHTPPPPLPLDQFQHVLIFSQPPHSLFSLPFSPRVPSTLLPCCTPPVSILHTIVSDLCVLPELSLHVSAPYPATYFQPWSPWTWKTLSRSMGFCLSIFPP